MPEQVRTNWPDGTGQYITNTNWTAFGELATVLYQQTAQNFLQRDFTYDDTTRQLVQASTDRQVNPQTVADVHYTYDPAGNITKIADSPAGGTADTQCFAYDYARRLTDAWTPSSGDCTTAPTVAGLGGSAPYWHTWTFDPVGASVGNRATETKHAATNTVATYTHPAAGADTPHATTRVVTTGTVAGTRNYSYDAAGNTTCRPNPTAVNNTCPPGSGSETLTWNSEDRLETVVDGTNNLSYLYDADGTRLISRDATATTLYLPGNEIRYTASSGTTTATRYYTQAGQTYAMRQPGTGITWLVTDPQGTQTIAIASGNQTISQRRQTPYGNPRGTTPTWPNPKGFVGGTQDPTGLTHLGVREYDPTTGQFISVDPIQDLANPQQWNSYAYANNNPTTNSDSSGLCTTDACISHQNHLDDRDQPPPPARPAAGGHSGAGLCTTDACISHHNHLDDRDQPPPPPSRSNAPAPASPAAPATTAPSSPPWDLHCARVDTPEGVTYCGLPLINPPEELQTDGKRNCKWVWIGCLFKRFGKGTVGVCLNGALGYIVNGSGDVCLAGDKKGAFLTASGARPGRKGDPNASWGWGAGLGVTVVGSDARDKNDLAGPFKYGGGNVLVAQGSYAAGTSSDGYHVHQGAGGLSLGTPAGASWGQSNTAVSGYLFNWCGFWICNVGHAR